MSFPFNKAAKVTIYQYATDNGHARTSADEYKLAEGGIFPADQILKSVVLSKEDIADLEKMVLNRAQVCNDGTIENLNDCMYNPHHCVVFSDSSGKTIAYIEQCYICDQTRTFPENAFGSLCGDFTCDLAYLFVKHGFDTQELNLGQCGTLYMPDTIHPSAGYFRK